MGWLIKEKEAVSRWYETDERIRFIIVGMANMAIRYLIFVLIGVFFSLLHYQYVLAFSWLLSSVTAFFAYKILVFRTDGNHFKEYLKCIATWTVSYVINVGMLQFLAAGMKMNVYAAQAVAIVIITIINYLLFKHFAFKQEPKKLTWWEKILKFTDVFGK